MKKIIPYISYKFLKKSTQSWENFQTVHILLILIFFTTFAVLNLLLLFAIKNTFFYSDFLFLNWWLKNYIHGITIFLVVNIGFCNQKIVRSLEPKMENKIRFRTRNSSWTLQKKKSEQLTGNTNSFSCKFSFFLQTSSIMLKKVFLWVDFSQNPAAYC